MENTGIEPVPFFVMSEAHRPSMLDLHYSLLVPYDRLERSSEVYETTASPSMLIGHYKMARQTRLERAWNPITFHLVRSEGGY